MTTKGELDRIAREENKTAAYWLLHGNDKVKELEQQRQDILHSSPAPSHSRPATATSGPGDPTAAKALKLAELSQEAQAWLAVVSKVEGGLSLRDQVYLQLRRKYRNRRGRQGWTAAVQAEFPSKMEELTGKDAEEFWISSRGTFSDWFGRICDLTVREAIREGLFPCCNKKEAS